MLDRLLGLGVGRDGPIDKAAGGVPLITVLTRKPPLAADDFCRDLRAEAG